MNRFPYIIPFVFLILFQLLALDLLCTSWVSDSDRPPSVNGADHPALLNGPDAIREKALTIVNEEMSGGSRQDRIVAAAILCKAGTAHDIYGLYDEVINRGTVYERMLVLDAILSESGDHQERPLQPEEERKILEALLNDPAYAIEERALYELSRSGDPRWIPSYRRALKAEDYYIRAGAARALGRSGDHDSLADLGKMVENESGWTRLCFAQALATLGDRKGMQILIDASSASAPSKLRAYAAGMRLEAGDLTVLPLLKSETKSRDDRVREIACTYLARSAPENEQDIFVRILSHGDFRSVNLLLARMKAFAPDRTMNIFREAFAGSVDKRGEMFSIFTQEAPDPAALLALTVSTHLEEMFIQVLENLYYTRKKKASEFSGALCARPELSASLRKRIIDTAGRAGDADDLPLLQKFLADPDSSTRLHAACSVLEILFRQSNGGGQVAP